MDERCSQIPQKIESSRNLTNPQYTLKSVNFFFFFYKFCSNYPYVSRRAFTKNVFLTNCTIGTAYPVTSSVTVCSTCRRALTSIK